MEAGKLKVNKKFMYRVYMFVLITQVCKVLLLKSYGSFPE